MTAPAEPGTAPARRQEEVVLRLRPIAHASPVADGLHVRGARTSFTVGGGPGLWPLWRALAAELADGRPAVRLHHLSGRPAVQGAVDLLLAQLAEHDLLVGVPDGWGRRGYPGDPPEPIARWLEAAAPDPVSAWHALRAATMTVRGDGRVAAAALRALRAAGIPATAEPLASGLDAGLAGAEAGIVAAGTTADSAAVAAMSGHDGAVVTPIGTSRSAPANLAAIAVRAGLRADEPVPHVLAALAGGAAAHRLICAVAGLLDPGEAASAFAPVAAVAAAPYGLPSVLVARLDPLRAEYHPWLGGTPADGAPSEGALAEGAPSEEAPSGGALAGGASAGRAAEPADLPAALAAAAALSDTELGVMPPAELADLPQLPAALARCHGVGRFSGSGSYPEGPTGHTGPADPAWRDAGPAVYGVGVNAEMARLAATTGWCAHVLETSLAGGRPVAVGATRPQADGILLRRLADQLVLAGSGGSGPRIGLRIGEERWAGSAQARLWWKAVTLRFAAPATMQVTSLAEGIFHAAVSVRELRLGWAVESTPGDAAAFAALNAAGALQVRTVPAQAPGQPPSVLVPVSGAQPQAGPAAASAPAWQGGDWIWPVGVATRERDLRDALRDLAGIAATTVLEPAALAGQEAAGLLRALRALGFCAVTVPV